MPRKHKPAKPTDEQVREAILDRLTAADNKGIRAKWDLFKSVQASTFPTADPNLLYEQVVKLLKLLQNSGEVAYHAGYFIPEHKPDKIEKVVALAKERTTKGLSREVAKRSLGTEGYQTSEVLRLACGNGRLVLLRGIYYHPDFVQVVEA